MPAHRRKLLREIQNVSAEELMQCWPDGRIKMRATQRLLQLRREHPDLFLLGKYEPLIFEGQLAECAVGFVRAHQQKRVAVIVPRLSSRVGFPPVNAKWGDTAVRWEGKLRDVFCTREVRSENSQIKLADAMSALPFAVLGNL